MRYVPEVSGDCANRVPAAMRAQANARTPRFRTIARHRKASRSGPLWNTCGSIADRLCTDCRCKVFSTSIRTKGPHRPIVVQLRIELRLRRPGRSLESSFASRERRPLKPVTPVVFNETINGRAYVIEVQLVSRDRWRACLRRREATTALMPFYGATPDDAARQLAGWLNKASGAGTTGAAAPTGATGDR